MSTTYEQTPITHVQYTPSPQPPRRHSSRTGWLVAAIIAVIVVGGAVVWYGPFGVQPGSAQAQPPVDPQIATIQQVIQRANTEQAQALSTQNPSVMSDTATAGYYQQLVQTNQSLLSQGVTTIELTSLTWGPVNVSGTTATATTTETWLTTFSDSTTMESTDSNLYTLVDQDGSWLIQDDQQPTAAGTSAQATPSASLAPPATPGTTAPPQPTELPSGLTGRNTSRNWSGYAATGTGYTAVSGTWTVPQLAASGAAGVGATWVGIGGINSRDLIQAGTQDVASGSGQSQFQAWIEMLPAASQQVPLVVAPGDSVSVSITKQSAGAGAWQIAFKNNTSGQTYQATVQYTSSQSSVEWIEEAPAGRGGILPLDNFGSVQFSEATASQNGKTVDLAQAGAQPITLLNATNQALAVPSPIASDGSSFKVARTSAPATTTTASGAPGRRPGRTQTGG
jgi:hypothetical protein